MQRNVWVIICVAMWCVQTNGAQAFFGDRERSAVNQFRGATLDIVMEDEVPIDTSALNVGENVLGSVRLVSESSLDVQYTVRVDVTDGSAMCDALTVQMSRGSTSVYSGPFASAQTDAQTMNRGDDVTWQFDVAAASGSTGNACVFDIVFDAVQSGGTGGFSDTEQLSGNTIAVIDTTPLTTPVITGWSDGNGQVQACVTGVDAWTNVTTTALQWQAVPNATVYTYEIVQPDGTSVTGTTANLFTPQIDMDSEGAWLFRVQAASSSATGAWSQTCTLHVDRTPPVPTNPVQVDLVTPPQTPLASNGVTFEYTASEPATTIIYFDKNPANFFDHATYAYRAPVIGTVQQYTLEQSIFTAFPTSGTYFYMMTITDRAGNVTSSSPGVFNVPSLPAVDVVTLNEIIANPDGNDNASMPGGEWVELYNRGALAVDVAGWRIKDATGKSWVISLSNSDADGDTSDTGETVIAPGGYLVVYRNGASMTLNNTGGEEVLLYDNYGTLMDQHTFSVEGMPVGKSVARFPDGIGVWIDPDGTPGSENALSQNERDTLRMQVFKKCFKETATHIVRSSGTLCDPTFVTYIGMIKDSDHVGLALPEMLEVQNIQEGEGMEQEEAIVEIQEVQEAQDNAVPTEDDTQEQENILSKDEGKLEDDILSDDEKDEDMPEDAALDGSVDSALPEEDVIEKEDKKDKDEVSPSQSVDVVGEEFEADSIIEHEEQEIPIQEEEDIVAHDENTDDVESMEDSEDDVLEEEHGEVKEDEEGEETEVSIDDALEAPKEDKLSAEEDVKEEELISEDKMETGEEREKKDVDKEEASKKKSKKEIAEEASEKEPEKGFVEEEVSGEDVPSTKEKI